MTLRMRNAGWVFALLAPLQACVQSGADAPPVASSVSLPVLGSPEHCAAYEGLPAGWGEHPQAGLIRIPAGRFRLGTEHGYAEEFPGDEVDVEAFWIDQTEVTNAQFASFVAATGYVTDAERQGEGAVFTIPSPEELAARAYSWWRFVPGASWRHPEGPASDIRERAQQPVVLVTQADAEAYASWLGRSLPTEAQWEYAAKAGSGTTLDRPPIDADGRPTANFWQGVFPIVDNEEDGYHSRSPVGCFAPNAFGLYDTIGNAWEWTADLYRGDHQVHGSNDPFAGVGAAVGAAQGAPLAVIKGGSHLCAANFCGRYRVTARQPQEADLPASHLGFRTVLSIDLKREGS